MEDILLYSSASFSWLVWKNILLNFNPFILDLNRKLMFRSGNTLTLTKNRPPLIRLVISKLVHQTSAFKFAT